jgi:integrase
VQGDTAKLAARFSAYQRARGFSDDTLRVRVMVVRLFDAWLEPRSILTARRADVEGFLRDRTRCSPSSRNNYLSHLRAFYWWAMREGLVESDPTALVERARVRKRVPRPIGEADFARALALADRRMRVWLLLAGVAGLRVQEIAGLRVDDLMFDAGVLVVVEPKGNTERTVPIHPALAEALRDYGVPTHDPLFPAHGDPGRRPMARRSIGYTANNYLAGLGIGSTMHKLRARFATMTYRSSRDLLLVAKLMGHSSTLTTEDYVALTPGADAVKVVMTLAAGPQHPSLFDA